MGCAGAIIAAESSATASPPADIVADDRPEPTAPTGSLRSPSPSPDPDPPPSDPHAPASSTTAANPARHAIAVLMSLGRPYAPGRFPSVEVQSKRASTNSSGSKSMRS